MNNHGMCSEILESYLQADAPGRAEAFSGFLAALAAMSASEEPGAASLWASRAVTPLLDYSSLRRLRKHLLPNNRLSHGLRIAVLGGPTTIQFVELLELFLAGAGIPAQIYQGEYGLFRQEILAPCEALDTFQPQVIFLATSGRDVARLPTISARRDEVAALLDAEVANWQALWRICQERWGATVVQNTFDATPWGVLGHHAVRQPAARASYLGAINCVFAEHAPAHVVLHDLSQLVTELGAREWFDPRFYLEAKMPCGPECLVSYAHSVMALLRGIVGKSRKLLVLDLDNTLWGGTVGDLGAGGVQVGQGSGEGEAFLTFQQYVKELHERGILGSPGKFVLFIGRGDMPMLNGRDVVARGFWCF